MDFIIAPLCIGCWVVPLVVIGGVYVVIRSSVNAVQTRGVGDDGIYCANCRFDLRGGTTWQCPECGTQLNQPTSSRFPRGGIIIKELHPPISHIMAIVLYLIGGFIPAVVAVLVLGFILPINYKAWTSVGVYPDRDSVKMRATYTYVTEAVFDGERGRSWTGKGDMETLTLLYAGSYGNRIDVLPSTAGLSIDDQANNAWDAVVQEPYWDQPGDDKEAMRQEFVELFALIADGDRAGSRQRAQLFIVNWDEYSEQSFHPVYTLLGFLAVLVAVGFLVRFAVREADRQDRSFIEKVQGVRKRYEVVIDSNLRRMERGTSS